MGKRKLYFILLITSVISFSCKDYLTVAPVNSVPAEQVFKSADDAITSIYGLYALMQRCVDQIFLAGEVQGDLVVAARGADSYIAEIAQNRITPQNPYTDYTNFYRVVVACNNAIVGLQNTQRLDPVNYTVDKLNYNTGEIVCIRSWAYLQLVKIWGDVPYLENAVTSIDSLTNNIAATPGMVILAKIEKDMEDLAYPMMQTDLNPTGMSWTYYSQFNNCSCPFLLSEINLYLGDYVKSWKYIMPFAPYGYNVGGSSRYSCQERNNNDAGVRWVEMFWWGKSDGFQRGYGLGIMFDGSKGQKNNLMHWTSNVNGGIYAVKPSSKAIKAWDSQPLAGLHLTDVTWDNNAMPIRIGWGDPRGLGASYYVSGNDTIIFKFLAKALNTFKSAANQDIETNDDMSFCIYRDGTAFLDVSELWNNMGLTSEALVPINGANNNTYGFGGVRLRGGVCARSFDPANGPEYNQLEKFDLEERALESAFEGHRWFDLVRFAKRANDPSILANAVAQKYPADQQAAIKAKLSNPNFWYWPYYYKNVAANKRLVQKSGY